MAPDNRNYIVPLFNHKFISLKMKITLLYIIGMLITYIITAKRAKWVMCNKNADKNAELTGVIIFSMFSWLGLSCFLLIRIITLSVRWIYKKL